MKLSAVVRVSVIALLLIAAFVAGQQSSSGSVTAQNRQKWEYQIVRAKSIDRLNSLGEDGWEAVSLTDNNQVFLKRAK